MPQNKRYRAKRRELVVTEYFVWAQDEDDALVEAESGWGREVDCYNESLPKGLNEWEVEEAPVE